MEALDVDQAESVEQKLEPDKTPSKASIVDVCGREVSPSRIITRDDLTEDDETLSEASSSGIVDVCGRSVSPSRIKIRDMTEAVSMASDVSLFVYCPLFNLRLGI